MMTKEKIIEMAREAGGYYSKKYPDEWRLDDDDLVRFAKLIAEKAIEPYLPYKQHIETMERAFDAHLKKARGQQ